MVFPVKFIVLIDLSFLFGVILDSDTNGIPITVMLGINIVYLSGILGILCLKYNFVLLFLNVEKID